MKIRNSRAALGLQIGVAALSLLGCGSPRQAPPVQETANSDTAVNRDEIEEISETALGKQADVLAHGDLARNGLEQLLVVNQLGNASGSVTGQEKPSVVFITRAAILEKKDGNWTEVLRCDEHLKNPNGYLGGSPAARVTGWRLEYAADPKRGLEMKFTPGEIDAEGRASGTGEPASHTVVVRWNASVKRYQSFDQSQERYLSDALTLETPQSILR